MTTISFVVLGVPAAQGSKRHVGGGRMIESSRKVAPWREAVKAAAVAALPDDDEAERIGARFPVEGPVEVQVEFRFARPAGHYGDGKNAGILKASAPTLPTSRALGDIDKLSRSTLDALTDSQVIADDSQVSRLVAIKRYATEDRKPGATIYVGAVSW